MVVQRGSRGLARWAYLLPKRSTQRYRPNAYDHVVRDHARSPTFELRGQCSALALIDVLGLLGQVGEGDRHERGLDRLRDGLAGQRVDGLLHTVNALEVWLLGDQRLDDAHLEVVDLRRVGVVADDLDLALLARVVQPGVCLLYTSRCV